MSITIQNIVGTGKPYIEIYNGSSLVNSFTLPRTDKDGIIEKWTIEQIIHEIRTQNANAYSITRTQLVKYIDGDFILSYKAGIKDVNDVLNMLSLVSAAQNKYTITLYPHSENNLEKTRNFQVLFDTTSIPIELSFNPARYMKGIMLHFILASTLNAIPIINPNPEVNFYGSPMDCVEFVTIT